MGVLNWSSQCREHKNKRNVKILSNSRPGAPKPTFDDLVSYELRSAKAGGSPSTVKGIDRLEKGSAAQWKWYSSSSIIARAGVDALIQARERPAYGRDE